MNLKKKKELAAKSLGVGKNKIHFSPEGLKEIKEAITKQDIKTLHEEGIITIKPARGRKTVIRRKRKKGPGKIKMKVKHRKQEYVKITRKLRSYLKMLKNNNEIDREAYYDLRKKIKMRVFKNASHFKEYIESSKKGMEEKKTKKTRDNFAQQNSQESPLKIHSNNDKKMNYSKSSKDKTARRTKK